MVYTLSTNKLIMTNKFKMAGYYLILYYCTLHECHTCHLNQ